MLSHDIHFSELEHYGIRGNAGHRQKVCIKGTSSENLSDILIGVLQGSVLGVLLFIIYINNLPNANTPKNMKNVTFADDNTGLVFCG